MLRLNKGLRRMAMAICLVGGLAAPCAAETITFEDLTLSPDSYWSGPSPEGTIVSGPYGPVVEGTFTSGGVSFVNRYDATYGSWSGFAYSNQLDRETAGWMNQFSAYVESALSGSNFAVAFGSHNLEETLFEAAFDPGNVGHLLGLPHFVLPAGVSAVGMSVANATYAALSMKYGDGFGKKFGQGDWFRLTAYGIDANGNALGVSSSILLADFQTNDPAQSILNDWAYMDLTALSGARTIAFNLSSSDSGLYGMNTPAYFAMDNLVTTSAMSAVPEPGSLLLILTGAGGLYCSRRRKGKSTSNCTVV